jgi:hypothetical protein
MGGGLGSGCSSGLGLRGRGLDGVLVGVGRGGLRCGWTNRMGSGRLLFGRLGGLRLLAVVVGHGVWSLAHPRQRA